MKKQRQLTLCLCALAFVAACAAIAAAVGCSAHFQARAHVPGVHSAAISRSSAISRA